MYRIVSKEALSPLVYRMRIEAARVARKAQAGQFVILRVNAQGERVPFTVAEADAQVGTVTVIFQAVGQETRRLAALSEGDAVADFVGPLGNPSQPHWGDAKRVLCIGGGVGTAVVYPQLKKLHELGVEADVITGARDAQSLILLDELRALAKNVYITTDDGSAGHHGRVTDILSERLAQGERYDLVLAIGPPIMMQAVCALTKEAGIRTLVSLNPIMVDGTGMCGCCRVTVGGEVRYACVDGPDFDGHAVDFAELIQRNRQFLAREAELDHECRSGLYGN